MHIWISLPGKAKDFIQSIVCRSDTSPEAVHSSSLTASERSNCGYFAMGRGLIDGFLMDFIEPYWWIWYISILFDFKKRSYPIFLNIHSLLVNNQTIFSRAS